MKNLHILICILILICVSTIFYSYGIHVFFAILIGTIFASLLYNFSTIKKYITKWKYHILKIMILSTLLTIPVVFDMGGLSMAIFVLFMPFMFEDFFGLFGIILGIWLGVLFHLPIILYIKKTGYKTKLGMTYIFMYLCLVFCIFFYASSQLW